MENYCEILMVEYVVAFFLALAAFALYEKSRQNPKKMVSCLQLLSCLPLFAASAFFAFKASLSILVLAYIGVISSIASWFIEVASDLALLVIFYYLSVEVTDFLSGLVGKLKKAVST